MSYANLKLFALSSNQELAKKIARNMGLDLGKCNVKTFSDGEIQINIEESVRGSHVFLIQSTSSPVNENLMELLIMVDALKRASVGSVNVVMPYYGYARQDRKARPREPITSKLVANMLQRAGVDRLVTIDLHASQIQGFFDIPVDNIYGTPALLADLRQQQHDNLMVVSPDVGGVVRARAVAKQLGDIDLAIIDKRRQKANESQVMHLIGDVKDRDCVIVDDMVDTAGTLCKAADALKQFGARRVIAYATHPVLSGKAIDNLRNSVIDELVVTDTIPLSDEAANLGKIRQVSVASMVAETIRRINNEESISAMFDSYL